MWNFMFFVECILLGAGLAMDAFSVSMADGLNDSNMSKKKMFWISGLFAIFQALMPMIGWVCVHTLLQYFTIFEPLIPWIALVLLVIIGGKMLLDGIKNQEETSNIVKLSIGTLLLQATATSIDALSVGFTIAEYDILQAIVSVVIIGAVTFGICFGGIIIGKKFGTVLANKAQILGGIILIVIGIEIFISGLIG